MVYAFESDVKIDDEILKSELGNNGDVKLKNIVSTIQREQNQIIRNVKDRILVVCGVAGSGKTSVALHRIAYLLYHDRKNIKAANILILSPNGIFTDYISHILPELGEENIREMSFDIFAYRELKQIAKDCEERYDQIERLLKIQTDEAYKDCGLEERYLYKQSREFVNELNGYVLELESDLVNFKNIRFKFINKSADEIMELFYYKFPDIPLLSRMEAVAEYVIDEAETLNRRNLDELEMAILMETFMQMYRTRDIYKLYSDFLEMHNLPALLDVPAEERVILYEDVFPILYLKYKLISKKNKREIKHLVIDEMQDYSYIQYLLIQMLFDCKMTILGDMAQTMESRKNDVIRFLPKILGRDVKMISMNKSYRQTVEIARYAQSIIGETNVELLERHGREPEVNKTASFKEAVEGVVSGLNDGIVRYDTIAVLTMSEKEAKNIYNELKEKAEQDNPGFGDKLYYLDRDSREFKRGIVVTTFYLAKGLEFDQVYSVYRDDIETPLLKQAKYIMTTRALHELYIFEYEK